MKEALKGILIGRAITAGIAIITIGIEDRGRIFETNWEDYKKINNDKYELDRIPIVESNLQEVMDGRDKAIKLAMEGKQKEVMLK